MKKRIRSHLSQERTQTNDSQSSTEIDSVENKVNEELINALIDTMFPDEIIIHIHSFLNPSDLHRATQVSLRWSSFIKDEKKLWQNHIKRDFPYLEQTQENAFNSNPYRLYNQECNRYRTLIVQKNWPFALPKLLAALRGELSGIELENSKILYRFAVANGHYDALPKIAGKEAKALRYAAKNGNLQVIMHLLETLTNISPDDKGEIFRDAAGKGHLNIVKYLLEKHVIPEINKFLALCHAVHEDKFDVVEYLIALEANIFSQSKQWALQNAVAKTTGCLKIFALLYEAGNVSPKDIEELLLKAIQFKRLDIIKYLIKKQEHLPNFALIKGNTLINAAEIRAPEIVAYLLEDDRDIPAEYKHRAKEIATKEEFTEIAEIINQNIASAKLKV